MNTKFVGEWSLSYCPLISLLFDFLDFEKCVIIICRKVNSLITAYSLLSVFNSIFSSFLFKLAL